MSDNKDEDMEELFGNEGGDGGEKNTERSNDMEELFGSESDNEDKGSQSKPPESKSSIDENDKEKSPPEMNELFGSDSDGEADMDKTEVSSINRRFSHESRTEMTEIFGSDVDDDGEEGANTFMSSQDIAKKAEHAKLCIPETKRLSDDPQMMLKLPHLIKIQTTPFSKETYNPEVERQVFSGATAMIRWRYKQNATGEIERDAAGVPIRESNSRLVKYSDGSYAMLIGGEVFECNIIPVRDTYVFCHRKSGPPEDTLQDVSTPVEGESGSDIKQQTCLECVGQINAKMHLQPSSVTSTSHELMSLRTNERYRKLSRLKKLETRNDIDPEKEAEVRAAALNEDIKRERKRQLQEGGRQRSYGGGGRARGDGPAMRAAYLQEGFDDDSRYDSVSIGDIKRGIKSGRRRRLDSEGEEEEDDEDDDGADMEDFIAKDDDEGGGDWGESEDEDYEGEEEQPVRKSKGERSERASKKDAVTKSSFSKSIPREGDGDDKTSNKRSLQAMTTSKDNYSSVGENAMIREEEEEDDDDDQLVGKVDKTSVDVQRKRAKRTIMDSDDED